MTPGQKHWLIFAIKLAIGLAIVAWLVSGQWDQIASLREWSIRWHPLAGTLACIFALVVITFLRWFFMVRSQGLTLRFRDAFELGYIGYFFSTFIPGLVGGDLVKAAYVAREQSQKAVAVATVVLDRIIGLYGMFVMGTIMTLWCLDTVRANAQLFQVAAALWTAAALGTAGLVIGFLAIFRQWRWVWWVTQRRWIGRPLANIFRSLEAYRSRLGVLVVCVVLSVLVHLLLAIGVWFVGLALEPDQPPRLGQLFLVVPVGMFLAALPISPGGLGVGEAAFGWLFRHCLEPASSLGLVVMLLFRINVWITTIPGFIYYLRGRQGLRELQHRAEELARLDADADATSADARR